MKFLFCAFFFIVLFNKGYSQQATSAGHCKIKGRIIDSASHQPIGYATVIAFIKGNTNVAGGIITDENGEFIIDNLQAGEYTVKIDFIGYIAKTLTSVVLSEKHPLNNLGDVPITSNTKTLNDVTITGSRNFMENHLDKLVYNVEKDVSSQGGVATDILKKVPMVSVDIDGNIDLLGDPNVRVFINGKPSAMFDNNLAEALKAIPASQIKSIEVITSPGAQYDAQGTGGIINIILKDNKAKGVNGNCSVSGGSRYQNGYANIHVKNGALDINASLSGNMQLNTKSLTSLNRTADSAQLVQNGYNTTQRNGYRPQAGFDYAITKNDDINGSFSYNNFGNASQGSLNQQQITNGLDTQTLNNSNNYFRYRGEDWNINYKRKFAKDGQELNLWYQGSSGSSDFNYQQNQRYTANDSILSGARGDNGFHDIENYLTVDYANPFSKDIMLNVGVKGTFSRMKSNSGQYPLLPIPDTFSLNPFQDNTFNFNRSIYAAYASVTFPMFKKYNLKIGVRDEYTINSSPGDTINIASDNFITPSAVISRTLNKNQTIKLSYAKRIQRPGYGQYNPFINATDPANLLTGNPGILPQKMHALESSYYRFFEKGSNILVTLFYRYSADDWQSYTTYYNSFPVGDTVYQNVTVSKTINAGTQQTGGLNISGTWAVNEKIQIRPNASFFEKYIQSNLLTNGSTSSFNYRGSINITYQVIKTLVAEFYSGYNSARYEVQGKYPSFASYSFAVRKQFLDKKATLSLSATDPFNKYTNQVTYISAANFSGMVEHRYPYQYFSLSFSYKFGKIEYIEKKPEPDENENLPPESKNPVP